MIHCDNKYIFTTTMDSTMLELVLTITQILYTVIRGRVVDVSGIISLAIKTKTEKDRNIAIPFEIFSPDSTGSLNVMITRTIIFVM